MKPRLLLFAGALLALLAWVGCSPDQQPTASSDEPQPTAKLAGKTIDVESLKGPHSVTLPDGRVAERRVHIFYKKGFGHKEGHGGGGGGKGGPGSTCYTFLASGAKWKTTEPYVLDETNADGLSGSFVASAIQVSLDAWNAQVAGIFGPRDTDSTVDPGDVGQTTDGKNEVFFADLSDPGVIAVTIVWGIFIGPPRSRELVEWDMIFEDPDFAWGDATLNSGLMDLQNIATHEAGHAGGLGHPPDECTEETMYRFASEGETKKRTLEAGDIAGIKALYK